VLAEEFCRSLGQRLKGSGFLKTLLLRRVGSTIQAGRLTAQKMLDSWQNIDAPLFDAESEGDEEFAAEIAAGTSRSLTPTERQLLDRFVQSLEANQERDPKYAVVLDCLRRQRCLERGCIIFSQYHDSVRWLAEQLVSDLPDERLAIYAGAGKSGIFEHGRFRRAQREEIKAQVKRGELHLLLGTDAASEGLNRQRLGSLINLDLPWNPTRLEQRKGRIQRIGQMHDTVFVYDMRYVGSVEDRVHDLLSERLEDVYTLFGQVPDVLEDVWIEVAIGENERAKQLIDEVPRQHPFDIRYERIEKIDWERCARVLDDAAKREALSQGW